MNSTMLSIPLALVHPVDRLRELNANKVAEIAISMRERGQLTPIEVAPIGTTGDYRLVFGAHRHAAAKAAGLTEILAIVFEGTADEERLREIDENLYRAELGPLDQASFLAERRAIWERLNRPVKSGRPAGAKKSRHDDAINSDGAERQLSFFADLKNNFGLEKRTVQRALKRKSQIGDELWVRLKSSPFAYKAGELDAIARMHMRPDQQKAVVDLLLSGAGAPTTVSAAKLQIMGLPASADLKQDTPRHAIEDYKAVVRAVKKFSASDRRLLFDLLIRLDPSLLAGLADE